MRIIGIDPGTVCCGYGIVEVPDPVSPDNRRRNPNGNNLVFIAAGDIKMNRKDTLPERLKQLYDSLRIIIDQYRPTCFCIEKIFYHKSIRSAFALGSTRGVAMLLAAEKTLPVIEYNPTELKMALTGYGRAEKQQVKEMVKRVLNLGPSRQDLSEDSSDALALCICHAHSFSQRRIKES
jgi:crossover junction endodeoxyribonuclease RuvC